MNTTSKAAILIDGGYFLRRLPQVRREINVGSPHDVANAIEQLVRSHLGQLNQVYKYQNPLQLLYRSFYYDASPYDQKAHKPVSKQAINYNKSAVARFRKELFAEIRKRPNFALRLGYVASPGDRSWILKKTPQDLLLKGAIGVSDLKDDDFQPNLIQKGVDMRIGLDIASITLKKQASIIILVSGDSDFVPAAKLARREGVTVILDPLWQSVSSDLSEHIDMLTSGFPRPQRDANP